MAGTHKVVTQTPIAKVRKWVRPLNILYTVTCSVDPADFSVPDMIANDFCFSCTREAGVQAYEMLALPRDIEARQFSSAGYSLMN